MSRAYDELPMYQTLAVITEEVIETGDSFGWEGKPPTPLREALENRGIVFREGLINTWVRNPHHVKSPDEIDLLVHKAMDEYRGGRKGSLTEEEKKVWGESCFKLGNKKLGQDTIVFNITSGTDCPCRDRCDVVEHCYAIADEELWKTPLEYRRRQTLFWDSCDVGELVKAMPIPRYFRFSESGDFRNQSDVDKMTEVANRLLTEHGIKTYGYTNRDDLDLSCLDKIAAVNGHGFMVGNSTVIKSKIEEGDIVCPGDCRYCNLCKEKRGIEIVFPIRRR